jgi:hypothetical protein
MNPDMKKAGYLPGQINQSHPKGTVDVIIAKRGGTGPADKLTPDPHKTHSPQPKVQAVYEW